MAENVLFLSSEPVDGATLVASTEVSTLPVSYLEDVQPEKKWRATGCAAENITIDLGVATICTALSLIGHNLTSAATLRVRGAATAAGVTAAPSVDTGAPGVSAWPASGKHTDTNWPQELSLVRWSNAVAYRYWRLDIVDAANPAGYVQAGRLHIGKAFQPSFNVDQNPSLGLVSPDAQARTPYGRTFTDPRGAASRRFGLPLSGANHTDMTRSLFQLQRYCGLARDFTFSLDPAATADFHLYSMQALFADLREFEGQPWFDTEAQVWRTSLTLTEPI